MCPKIELGHNRTEKIEQGKQNFQVVPFEAYGFGNTRISLEIMYVGIM